MSYIEISTERLLLKPLTTEYLQSVNEYALNEDNTKYMMYLPNRDSDETLDFLKRVESEWEKDEPSYYEFAVICDGAHIGGVCVYFSDGIGELGWILHRDHWGKGYAYEAAKAMTEYFSKRGHLHYIAHCDAANIGSYRVMEKLGMMKTGEYGGRKNRSADHESVEYQYELHMVD